MSERIRIGLAQVHSLLGDVNHNLEKHLEYVRRAKEKELDIIVFPELSLTGYLLRDLAYEISDKCFKAIEKIREESKGICIVLGCVYEKRIGIYYNSIVVVCDGEIFGFIPKLYLPNYGLFEESRYFKEGSSKDVKVFEWKGWRFGSVICEDAWHPEPVELLARLGADLVFIHASSPLRGLYGKGETFIENVWRAIAVTRAVENTVYIAFINRVGEEDEEFFWGGSMVIDPTGEVIAEGKKMEEDLVVVELDKYRLVRARRFSSFKVHRKDIHRILGDLE